MTHAEQVAVLKVRWSTFPTRWADVADRLEAAPPDVLLLIDLLEQAWEGNRVLQERLERVQAENARLRIALGQEFPVQPALEGGE